MVPVREPSTFTPDDVLEAWQRALLEGLGAGRTLAPSITNPTGLFAQGFRQSIGAEMQRRTNAGKPPFDQAALDASSRVARDLGAICAIMADATGNKVVTEDVFGIVRQLARTHAACPQPSAIGTGPFC